MTCEHLNFNVHADIQRLTDVDGSPRVKAFSLDLKVFCKDCGEQFEFVGFPNGWSAYQPTVSIDGKTAFIPVMPHDKPPDAGMPGYSVRASFSEQAAIKTQ